MVSPRSASRVPAIAIGPGVGGTRQWVAYRPPESAVAITARETLLWLASALEIGLKITKPESQKTGIPVM